MSFVTMYVVSNKNGVVNCLHPHSWNLPLERVQSDLSFGGSQKPWGLDGDLLAIRVSTEMAHQIYEEVVAKHPTKAAQLMRNFAHSIQKVGDIT